MSILVPVFKDSIVQTPIGLPEHVTFLTEEIQIGNVCWLVYPKHYRSKDGKEAAIATNGASTLYAVLEKRGDVWHVLDKHKAFGRTYQWLMTYLSKHLQLENA